MKSRHVFVESMCAPILETLQNGPIDLLVGRFDGEQITIRAVIIVVGISVDNEEAFKCQALSFGFRSHSNCRLCTMPSREFYTFSTLSDISDDSATSTMNHSNIMDAYNNINSKFYPTRDSISNITISSEAENIWWKQVLFNKNKKERGHKKLRLSQLETDTLKSLKLSNLKPIGNNIMMGVLSPFNTRFGQLKCPLIQPDLCFPPDKLHSFDKGIVEYTLKNIVSLMVLYQKEEPATFSNNMSIIDQKLLSFDIFQPISYWGNKPQRRIPGLSGIYLLFLNILILIYLFVSNILIF